jgi:hypothetical protein
MEWGPHLKNLEKLQDRGVRVKALEGRPYVPEYLEDFWHAYQSLDRCRQHGVSGPQPIQHSEIACYCDLHGWTGEFPVILAFLCRELDNRVFKKLEERRASEATKRGNAKGSNRRS